MQVTYKEKLLNYIDKMDEYQIRLLLGFVRKLFGLLD